MGSLFKFILFTIIAYFIFRFLNRLMSGNSSPNVQKSQKNKNTEKKDQISQDIKWDAETVDYEEIETKQDEKK